MYIYMLYVYILYIYILSICLQKLSICIYTSFFKFHIHCLYSVYIQFHIDCIYRYRHVFVDMSIQCLYDIQTILAYLSIQHLFYIDEKTSISYRHIDCRPCKNLRVGQSFASIKRWDKLKEKLIHVNMRCNPRRIGGGC